MDIPTGNLGAIASTSWDDQLEAIAPLLEDSSNDLAASLPGFLISDDNDSMGLSCKPPFGIIRWRQRLLHPLRPPSLLPGNPKPSLGVDLQDVCKRTADKLLIPLPNTVAETTTSC